MIDLHVHTWRCRHAVGTADEYVQAAAERGVRTLAFTEHLPLPDSLLARVPEAAEYAMPMAEFDEYVADVAGALDVGGSMGVEVLLGVEIDAVAECLEHAAALLKRHPFDVVLGSVHFIDDWAFDDPDRTERYAQWRLEDLWERYFDDLIAAGRSGLADVIAHADLVKKFYGRPETPVGHLYRSAAEALSGAGMAVEVNTAGLRKPCAEMYPSLEFLAELRRADVPATIGSDAHRPQEVGADGDLAVALLREAGYRSVVVFRNRQAEEVGLDEL